MSRRALEVIEGGKSAGRAWLRELYSKYGSTVYGRCQYLLKNPTAAEDAMQDVFAKAMANDGFRGESSPLTWLLKIATHHCLNVLRGDGAAWHDQYSQQEQLRGGEGHGGPQALEARDLVRRTLQRFDHETQAAVVHYYLDEMTLKEVAELLERSVPTIRKRLRSFAEATGQPWSDE